MSFWSAAIETLATLRERPRLMKPESYASLERIRKGVPRELTSSLR